MTSRRDTRSSQYGSAKEIDQELLRLLKCRIEMAQGSTGVDSGMVEASGRREIAALLGVEPEDKAVEPVLMWLRHTDSLCASLAEAPKAVVYLGPMYSYSYLAAVKYFGLGADLVPVTTISAVFEELVRGQSAFGVVPIENNTDGRVVDTLGRFAQTPRETQTPVEICGEVLLPIHHCLLGTCTRSEVKEVHSKPQALSQCRGWLAQHLPGARLVEVSSTATAAATAASEQGVAAIASREAGIHHRLQVIDANIEDNQQNVTRFAIIGNRRLEPTGRDKTSMMFQLTHAPGALAQAMMAFKESNVNLTWIESFPLPDCPNEYLFFVELEGHRENDAVKAAIDKLSSRTIRLEVLGSYPRGVN